MPAVMEPVSTIAVYAERHRCTHSGISRCCCMAISQRFQKEDPQLTFPACKLMQAPCFLRLAVISNTAVWLCRSVHTSSGLPTSCCHRPGARGPSLLHALCWYSSASKSHCCCCSKDLPAPCRCPGPRYVCSHIALCIAPFSAQTS